AARPDLRSANRLLARVGRRGGAWVAVLAVNVAVLAVAETALPAVLGRTIDGALGRAAADHWLMWSALLIGVLVACDVTDELGAASATARSTAWLRRTTLRHLVAVRLRSLDRFSPGDLVSRLVGNTEDAGAVGPDFVAAVTSVVLAAAGVVALAIIDPWLCATFLTGMPVLLLMFWAFAKDASELSERYLETQGVIAARLVGALRGARTIAAAGTTEVETRRVLAPLEDLHRHGKGMWRAQTRITAQDTLLFALLEIAVLAVAGIELSRGRISPGELFAASQYVGLASSASSAVSSLTGLIRERAAVARVDEILHLPVVRYGTRSVPPGPGRLDFRGVSVRAGERVLIDHLNLVVDGGTLLAVVGRSGAG
ncbi:MAG: ABC transporter ATP-binding protein/permease, partial [Actinomycetota bacterium]|nr:ABC transporter ATP-binding protein/permease [Actinomycetota bacterium]